MAKKSIAKEKKGTGFSLKDQLFNRERVTYLAELFQEAESCKQEGGFDADAFIRQTMKGFNALELKERIVHITVVLEGFLSSDYRVAVKQIIDALPEPLDPTLSDDDFGDFIFAPLGEFVVRNGLAKKDLKRSLKTLKEITQRFSMEDAIRAFINAHPDETLAELTKWSTDKNYHLRRLVSEGTRPLLPWSKRLVIDVDVPIPLLDTLHADPTRFVSRSVSNHLNDIAKTDAKLVLKTLKRWHKQDLQREAELKWMTKHALRTLVKKGDSDALRLLGYHENPKIKVSGFKISTPAVVPGESLEFSFDITAERDEPLMVDYVIDFVKANGSLAPKVHKLKQLKVAKGKPASLSKRHKLHANATTYTLYPGTHRVTLQINGKPFGTKSFEVLSL